MKCSSVDEMQDRRNAGSTKCRIDEMQCLQSSLHLGFLRALIYASSAFGFALSTVHSATVSLAVSLLSSPSSPIHLRGPLFLRLPLFICVVRFSSASACTPFDSSPSRCPRDCYETLWQASISPAASHSRFSGLARFRRIASCDRDEQAHMQFAINSIHPGY